MSLTAPESFGQRVDAVFGALDHSHDQGGQGKQWSLSREQVFRSGRNDDSSEEDDLAAESGPLHGSLLDADEHNVHRDLQGNVVQPSFAFCRALDNEQEYDEVDAVAGTTLRSTADLTDAKPHRLTEVLDDNAFERRMRSRHAAQPSHGHAEAIETVIDTGSQHAGANSSLHGNHDNQWNSSMRQHSRPGRSLHSAAGARHQRRSTVPDHVRHPDSYTCYVLDEPLVVGGGDKGANTDGGRSELEQAARAASTAAAAAQMPVDAQHQPLDLPAFGAGIEFRPRKKLRQDNKAAAPSAALNSIVSGLAGADEDTADAEQEHDEQMADSPKANLEPAAAAKPRRRQYRSKPGIT